MRIPLSSPPSSLLFTPSHHLSTEPKPPPPHHANYTLSTMSYAPAGSAHSVLLPTILFYTTSEYVPGSWRQTLSPHTVQYLHPTEAGCCPESRCTAVMSLEKQWREDTVAESWDVDKGSGNAPRSWQEICSTLPGLTAKPVTTMAWPHSCSLGSEEPCRSHIMTVLSREALKNWLDLGIQAICSQDK